MEELRASVQYNDRRRCTRPLSDNKNKQPGTRPAPGPENPEMFFGVAEHTDVLCTSKNVEERSHSESPQRTLKKSFTMQFLEEHLKSDRPREKIEFR